MEIDCALSHDDDVQPLLIGSVLDLEKKKEETKYAMTNSFALQCWFMDPGIKLLSLGLDKPHSPLTKSGHELSVRCVDC